MSQTTQHCLGMPPGFDSPCGVILEPHGPHPMPPDAITPPTTSDRLIAQRIRAIAAIHAVAQWLTDHPDAPLPHSVDVRANPGPIHELPDGQRVEAIDRFAAGHGAYRYDIEHHEYARLTLGDAASHGIEITYTLSTTRRNRGEQQ